VVARTVGEVSWEVVIGLVAIRFGAVCGMFVVDSVVSLMVVGGGLVVVVVRWVVGGGLVVVVVRWVVVASLVVVGFEVVGGKLVVNSVVSLMVVATGLVVVGVRWVVVVVGFDVVGGKLVVDSVVSLMVVGGGLVVVVIRWVVVASLAVVGSEVVGGKLVVDVFFSLMVVGTGLVVVVVRWVVVRGAVGCWVGAGLLSLLGSSSKSSCVLTLVEGPGLLVGEVLVGGSDSGISKSTETFVVPVPAKEATREVEVRTCCGQLERICV